MLSRSRRVAREGALRALYEIEVGKSAVRDAIESTIYVQELSHDLADYMERLVLGVNEHRRQLDALIAKYLKDYDFSRLATVDRNLLRIATFEILHVPEMPPAVSINEAIEIAKRYSTFESGKFINGVLGRLLLDTPKANWDPTQAPAEQSEEIVRSPEPVEVEEIDVAPEDESFRAASRIGGWKLKADD
ncbi:transcription antitermination factor NusB [Fimbriimonas ginsengisoli]|uniref:Transcription antitermination protein NusB n=1 Tax=Fimbriimonas ginsengisoli Gsoil 348 TaxID=661478 RepID=A0A068NTE4_FIMGI|nr:transcription antitermination factor NusB [Fimbriimonas ginsengisoli]AIE86823.1 Transcription termination protein NusB [Fimbriimonas ginsengisoli Gsoil 348]